MPSREMPSKTVIASYVLDWVVIVLIAAVGGGLNYVTPRERAFSLVDLSIAYPLRSETVSIVTVGVVSLAAPAVIMALLCLIIVPGTNGRRSFRASGALRRKLWELYASVTGLALSVALAFFVTQGLKSAVGRPRPHFLAVCNPAVDNLASHVVGNYAQDLDIRWVLVDHEICQAPNRKELFDAFRSFPSGHCSFAWSGLLYLSLFLCAKFSFTIPVLPLHRLVGSTANTQANSEKQFLPLHHPIPSGSADDPESAAARDQSSARAFVPIYNRAAAPPTYGVVLVLIPIAVAAYIATTRYADYWHHSFDVIGGSLIGIVSAIIAFRLYHLPLHEGWAWGPRSKQRSFGAGLRRWSDASPAGP